MGQKQHKKQNNPSWFNTFKSPAKFHVFTKLCIRNHGYHDDREPYLNIKSILKKKFPAPRKISLQ